MSKAKKQFYDIDNIEVGKEFAQKLIHAKIYIKELEQDNQELLKALILEVEYLSSKGYSMSRETKELFDKIKDM